MSPSMPEILGSQCSPLHNTRRGLHSASSYIVSRRHRLQAVDSGKYGPHWQEALAQKIEERKEYLSDKWRRTNLSQTLKEGQSQILEGWRSTEAGKSIEKDIEALQARWRRAELEEPPEWRKVLNKGVKYINIFGPIVAGLVLAFFGLTVTVVVGVSAIVIFIPYAILAGRAIDTSAVYAAFQIALIQLFTLFTWVAYAGAEWTMTRNMTEEERRQYLEEQELQRMHLDELKDFDTRLIDSGSKQIDSSSQEKDRGSEWR